MDREPQEMFYFSLKCSYCLNTLSLSSSDTTLREESPPPYVGVVQTSVTSTKTTERLSFKGKRFLIHRDSGISLTPAAHSPAIYAASTSRNEVIDLPIKKWAGVKAFKSSELLDKGNSGLEFKIPSKFLIG
ncbi:hypothetical protein TNCV_454361 [Trichonephila clavipes]|nr:hypothetical protein TNCV_454361 [Trichonephila clavipes]